MSMASLSKQTATAAKPASSKEKSRDFAVPISVGVVTILVLVAIYALSVHSGVNADELGLMVQYP
jgi:hypothetical protein